MIKKRKPFVALLLAIVPGLGQIYNGQLLKGSLFLLFDIFIPILFGLSGVLLHISGLAIMVLIGIAFLIYRSIDAFSSAKKLQVYELKPYNKWYYYLLFTIMMVILRTFLDAPLSTGIKTFKAKSPSMLPLVEPGDWFVADLNAYSKNRIEYGDVVLFMTTKGEIWTHRVIGLPLDSIEMVDGVVFINGRPNEIQEKRKYVSDGKEVIELEEKLTSIKRIKILEFKNFDYPETRTLEKQMIPENEYFLLGDNRDNSYDSRFIGTIKRQDIIGKAIYTYWGKTTGRININLRAE